MSYIMNQKQKQPLYEGHVWLSCSSRFLLGLSASCATLLNLRRADLVGIMGELTSTSYFLRRLHQTMLMDVTGRRILHERPRMTHDRLDPRWLRTLPMNTLGKQYIEWMDMYGFQPGMRSPVRFINHEEKAYVMQRYRESHDFYHVLTGLPATLEGEVILKWFEWINMRLPIAILSAISGSVRLLIQRTFLLESIGWAIWNGKKAKPMINVYWEEELMTDIHELRKKMGIFPYSKNKIKPN